MKQKELQKRLLLLPLLPQGREVKHKKINRLPLMQELLLLVQKELQKRLLRRLLLLLPLLPLLLLHLDL